MKTKPFIYILVTAILSVTSAILLEAQVKITDGAVLTMDPNSLLELESTNKGVLLPRVAIGNLSSVSPLSGTVPVGMQVFSSGGAVPDGFYYWDGTKWVQFQSIGTGMRKLSTLTKTTSGAIAKSDNIVYASGDITLTLPVVASTDDGLEISVKNTGTYMDIITITGATGSETIDGYASSKLYRGWGRTYVAKSGNWVRKENVGRLDNIFDVSINSPWQTVAQVVEFLGAHMTGPSIVEFGGGSYDIDATQTINLPYPVTFKGLSYGETKIVGTSGLSGTPMFICQSECYFKMLDFTSYANASGNDGIRFTQGGTYHEVKDCGFNGFNKGLVSSASHSQIWVFEVAFTNCTGAGIEIADGSTKNGGLKISECMFINCAKGINLLSGDSAVISINNSAFVNTPSGTDIGIQYVPATFTNFNSMFITSNTWNNQGSFYNGFDFSRTDGRDANAVMINNIGLENKNPHCQIVVHENTTGTTITTADTLYKANWTNDATSYTCKWTLANNRITYQPKNTRDAWLILTGDLFASNNNQTLSIAIIKNGVKSTHYGHTDVRTANSGIVAQFSTIVYLSDIALGDYLEFFVTSAASTTVTIGNVHWFANTQ